MIQRELHKYGIHGHYYPFAEQKEEGAAVNVPLVCAMYFLFCAVAASSSTTLFVNTTSAPSALLQTSFGAKQLKPFLEGLAARASYYISAYPNAGLPNSLGHYQP